MITNAQKRRERIMEKLQEIIDVLKNLESKHPRPAEVKIKVEKGSPAKQ